MQRQYELLSITSGTHSDADVKGILQTVTDALREAQMTDIHEYLLGKRRLAYPIRGNERFGTYALTTFKGEPSFIKLFNEKLRYIKGVMRTSLKEVKGAVNVVSFKEREEENRPDITAAPPRIAAEVSLETIAHQASKTPVPVATTTTARQVLSQEELDRRIDAILAQDEVNVEKI